ncbi:hypothetical protein [Bowmanella dokdonensis]|uniref:Sugar transporter n=1 Tax=Bowmanella dokdonensis TaxID=751969 RepID=A0A939DK10_9ALTE|nr:hypothetical protein [Bowmanella dokdonensis]MBN7823752.1 hypothetical protein [Bowmanella dokdonensis]
MSATPMPKGVKVFAWIMLVWNLLGVAAFFMHVTLSPDALAQLPAEQQVLYENIPVWSTLAFAVAVCCALAANILLLMRNALALPLFVLSLLGILVQQYYNFMVVDSLGVMGPSSLVMPALIMIFALALIIVSHRGKQQSWLS